MAIRKTQCINNHFFDGNKYTACPICGAPEKGNNENTDNNELRIVPENVNNILQNVPENADDGPIALTDDAEVENNPENKKKSGLFSFKREKKNKEEINIPDDKTTVLGDLPKVGHTINSDNDVKPEKVDEEVNATVVSAADVKAVNESVEEKTTETEDIYSAKAASEPTVAPSLTKQIEEKAETVDSKTVGRYTTDNAEPTVGWLVSLKGSTQGMSFELNEGKNSIGRMRTNKVVLDSEQSVSREKHAYVIFDSKNNNFYIQSGETDKMTYLNSEPVFVPQNLAPYDKIELGNCELLFVPLCGDAFSWDGYIE